MDVATSTNYLLLLGLVVISLPDIVLSQSVVARGELFSTVKCSDNNENVCIADQPTESYNSIRRLQCSAACSRHGWNWFNFIDGKDQSKHGTGQCQLFDGMPQRLTVTPYCVAFKNDASPLKSLVLFSMCTSQLEQATTVPPAVTTTTTAVVTTAITTVAEQKSSPESATTLPATVVPTSTVSTASITTTGGTPTLVAQLDENIRVTATALLHDQLFVTHYDVAQVSVYNTLSFQLMRIITFSGLGQILYGLETSAVDNCLYVSDNTNDCVHRVDLSTTSPVNVLTWSVRGGVYRPSMTSGNNVLVATDDGHIKEYTPSGSLVRTITVSNTPRQAVEVNTNVWAYVGYGSMHAVCTVLTNGTVIKCFGSVAQPGFTLAMSHPRALTIDTRGYILVTDWDNNRILVVDPTLTSARQLQLPVDPTSPYVLSYDESLHRMYVGEWGGLNRVLVIDGIQW